MILDSIDKFSISLAKSAGKIIMSYYGKIDHIYKKSTNIDLVTKADLESEKHITTEIKNKFPNHNILSEENGFKQLNSDYCWIIDPLDGTTNYVHKLPIFAISIALQYKKKTILGVVYNPVYEQCFHATKNYGAYLNSRPINVSSTNTLSESLIATGFPYVNDRKWEVSFDIFKDFYSCTQGIRRLGSAALDLCFVAMGRFDGFYEFNLKPWDICAGDLILRESGGISSDWDGQSKLPFSGSRILASNKKVHTQMSAILMNYKKTYFDSK